MHEKRARFNHEIRSRDAIVVQRNQSPRHSAGGKNYTGDQKRVWVKRAQHKSVEALGGSSAARTSAEGIMQNTEAKDGDGVQLQKTGPESCIAKTGKSEMSDVLCAHQKRDQSHTVQEKAELELCLQSENDNSGQAKGDVTHDGGAGRGCTMGSSAKGTSGHVGLKLNMEMRSEKPRVSVDTGKSAAVSAHQYARGRGKFEIGGPSEQRNVFSAKDSTFASRTAARQYRPGNFRGSRIMSVAPGTKPGPRWCPIGLSHTQKRRVQRLRALEIKEEITEKELEEWFHRGRPMVPLKMIWKKKHIMVDKNRNADDIVADRISDNFRDAATQMDVHQGG
jgi:hypothetical protein